MILGARLSQTIDWPKDCVTVAITMARRVAPSGNRRTSDGEAVAMLDRMVGAAVRQQAISWLTGTPPSWHLDSLASLDALAAGFTMGLCVR